MPFIYFRDAGKSANASAERGGYTYGAKIIADVVVAFLLVLFFAHLPAARDPDPDPLRQVRHLAAAAFAAPVAAVGAEAADQTRPAFFLFGCALHPLALRPTEARPADAAIGPADLREVDPAQRHP